MQELEIRTEDFSPRIVLNYREPALYDVAEHTHDFFMIYYIVSGSNTIYIEDESYEVRKGDLVFINPGERHWHPHAEAMIFYMGIDNFKFNGVCKNRVPVADRVLTPTKFPKEIYECYRSIMDTQEKREACWNLMTKAFCLEFFAWVVKEIAPAKSEDVKDYFQLKLYDKNSIAQMMTQYFDEHYMRHISVEEIARYTYLSTTYVTKIYKEVTGETPISYLINVRMKKARELLMEGHLSIQDISKQIGYEDPYYFSKLFRKKYGVSPTNFRKNLEVR